MALDNLKSGIECRLIKSVRELAQAAADTPDETAFAQFAALDKAAAPRRAANLFPEAEDFARLDFNPINGAQGKPQVVDLAGRQRMLLDARKAVPQG